MEVFLNPLVLAARVSAIESFAHKKRKVPKNAPFVAPPYWTHLEEVAVLLVQGGFDADVVAAGYLHDHVEDIPGWSVERIARDFNPRVAELVGWVTQRDKSDTWEARNADYFEQLKSASDDAIAVSCADKTSNVRALLVALCGGFPVKAVVKRGWQVNSAKLHQLAGLYRGRVPAPILCHFDLALDEFDRRGAALAHLDELY